MATTTLVLNEQNKTKTFEYGLTRVKDLQVNSHKVPSEKGRGPKNVVDSLLINDELVKPSKRFWTSIQCRFGFSPNMFRYFDHAEVFQRISERAPNDKIRFCIEKDAKTGINIALAVTNPNNAAVRYDQLQDLMGRSGVETFSYTGGIVRSSHKPKVNGAPFKVGGDDFVNQFVIDTPIDGFGKPNIYLSMMRLICLNGAIGYNKAFRSELSTGKKDDDIAFALLRAIDGFNNEEGFAAMRDRFSDATKSWASVGETQRLYKTLSALATRGELSKKGRETTAGGEVIETASPVFHNFHKMTGDITTIYGLANVDSLSMKRQRTLPAACKVYDLINFATEIATHHTSASGGRAMQSYVGELIANEYDLEGTCDQFSDWQDFFISDANAIDTAKILQNKR